MLEQRRLMLVQGHRASSSSRTQYLYCDRRFDGISVVDLFAPSRGAVPMLVDVTVVKPSCYVCWLADTGSRKAGLGEHS